ncbi:MAG TPA: hypothetical protein PLO23_03365, partial [Alphaproteobacteria bacterium]|nr:hypothetical protein [Alphaproteobacteria bacterium]
MSSLSSMEKPSLVVVIRSGGGACCARHPVDEQRYYDMTLRNLKKILGAKLGTDDYPVPTYNDLAMFSVGWSGGNVMGAGQAMDKTPSEVAALW